MQLRLLKCERKKRKHSGFWCTDRWRTMKSRKRGGVLGRISESFWSKLISSALMSMQKTQVDADGIIRSSFREKPFPIALLWRIFCVTEFCMRSITKKNPFSTKGTKVRWSVGVIRWIRNFGPLLWQLLEAQAVRTFCWLTLLSLWERVACSIAVFSAPINYCWIKAIKTTKLLLSLYLRTLKIFQFICRYPFYSTWIFRNSCKILPKPSFPKGNFEVTSRPHHLHLAPNIRKSSDLFRYYIKSMCFVAHVRIASPNITLQIAFMRRWFITWLYRLARSGKISRWSSSLRFRKTWNSLSIA